MEVTKKKTHQVFIISLSTFFSKQKRKTYKVGSRARVRKMFSGVLYKKNLSGNARAIRRTYTQPSFVFFPILELYAVCFFFMLCIGGASASTSRAKRAGYVAAGQDVACIVYFIGKTTIPLCLEYSIGTLIIAGRPKQ